MELTRNELRIMRIFWTANKPLSRSCLLELNPDTDWDMAALHSGLNSLLAKGAIREDGFYKHGKRIGRLFAPEYTLEDYLLSLIEPVKDIIDYRLLFEKLMEKADRMIECNEFR